ncbi:MAG: hypothetical protein MK240_07935 [Opitutales bacterium]|nr:hypothetical protein [Opitutales bacterium]
MGIKENRLINWSAALIFSSLIDLIPVTAIMILVSGIALDKTDLELMVINIYKGISYIVSQLASLEELASEDAPVVRRFHDLLEHAQRSAISDLTMKDIIDLKDKSNRSDDLNTNPNELSAGHG